MFSMRSLLTKLPKISFFGSTSSSSVMPSSMPATSLKFSTFTSPSFFKGFHSSSSLYKAEFNNSAHRFKILPELDFLRGAYINIMMVVDYRSSYKGYGINEVERILNRTSEKIASNTETDYQPGYEYAYQHRLIANMLNAISGRVEESRRKNESEDEALDSIKSIINSYHDEYTTNNPSQRPGRSPK